jgi:hypothetical protein
LPAPVAPARPCRFIHRERQANARLRLDRAGERRRADLDVSAT